MWWELNFSWTPADRAREREREREREPQKDKETDTESVRVCSRCRRKCLHVDMCWRVYMQTHTALRVHVHMCLRVAYTHTPHTHIQTRAGCERKRGAARISIDLVYRGYTRSIETHKTRTHILPIQKLEEKKTYGVREKEG